MSNCDLKNATLEELIVASAGQRAIIAEYQRHGIAVPEEMMEHANYLDRRIKRSVRAEKLAELKMAKARYEALKTDEEKRKDLEGKIAELEASLEAA